MNRRYQSTSGRKSQGLSTLGWLLTIPVVIVALLILAIGFFEARKAYWDARVKEMCEKDGGVQIFDKLRISRADIELLGRVDGKIDVPVKQLAKPNTPAYAELRIANIHEGNPSVTRTESTITRRADQVVIARWIVYSRFGGDFPSPGHPSSFRCPDLKKITSDLQTLFVAEGDSK